MPRLGHTPAFTYLRGGRVKITCSCGWSSKVARYVSPNDVHERHVMDTAAGDLRTHYESRRGA